jgi:uncharacterized protein
MRVRIPGWTTGATISINGVAQSITTTPGSYATITRSWASGDTVTVRLPMQVAFKAANDNANVVAVTYGPVVLSGNFGNTTLSSLPALTTTSVTRTSSTALNFTAIANGSSVNLGPFYDAHGYNYSVYWSGNGQGTGSIYRLVNVGSGLVLGIQNMSTADGGRALQWSDSGTADHNWEMITDGSAVRFRNVHSGKVLGVQDMSTVDNAAVLQWADNGTADHRWTLLDQGNGTYKIRNVHSGKLLAIQNNSTANGAFAVQDSDNGTVDNRWRLVRNA